MKKIPALTYMEALEYTTEDKPEAVITIGIIKDGQISYTVYGENGKVLEPELHTYEIDYPTLANHFLQHDLGMLNTRVLGTDGDLGKYWEWKETDAYLSAGDIRSNIEDMLLYAQMQLDNNPYFIKCHDSLETINDSTERYRLMDINIDEIGMAWSIDKENGIIWHNGATGNYNAYIGFSPTTGNAVVVLSNLPPSYRIPATIIGVKLLKELNTGE